MRGGRAGADHAEVRAAQAEADGQVAGDHVADGARNVERRGLLGVVGPFPGDRFVFDAREAADAGAHDGAAAIAVFLGEVEARIRHRLDARAHAVVHERIHAPRFLGRDVRGDVEAFDFARETRGEGRGIDARDGLDAALARQNRGPCGRNVTANWRNDTEPGNDDTSLGHTILCEVRADGRRRGADHCQLRAGRENEYSGLAAIRDVA